MALESQCEFSMPDDDVLGERPTVSPYPLLVNVLRFLFHLGPLFAAQARLIGSAHQANEKSILHPIQGQRLQS